MHKNLKRLVQASIWIAAYQIFSGPNLLAQSNRPAGGKEYFLAALTIAGHNLNLEKISIGCNRLEM